MENIQDKEKVAHEKECADEKFKCEYCKDTGEIEIMGGSDSDEWGVVDVKRCTNCQDD